ncbi:fibroleukin-like [Saccostrea echinata]|uniref:fibroleukin-like n=1 Tax=Saccostrea echinata TaxID=191078 RepID=UPI002A8315EC|nr:fibroleukin-like [Saccostrea echinata]
MNCENKIQEIEQKFNRNIVEIYALLNNRTLQTAKKGCNLTESGVYEIYPFDNETLVSGYCDMEIDGGGWTAIQKRVNISVNFNRTWADYKNGFGNPDDSYWIGNDVIHQLTKRESSSLYVSITLQNGTTLYELYQQFSINDEIDNYRLFLGGTASGTLGDRMLNTGDSDKDLSGMNFSKPDKDNDRNSEDNCAAYGGGGWWFNWCTYAFLNGQWSPARYSVPWYPTVGKGKYVKGTLMLIRRH